MIYDLMPDEVPAGAETPIVEASGANPPRDVSSSGLWRRSIMPSGGPATVGAYNLVLDDRPRDFDYFNVARVTRWLDHLERVCPGSMSISPGARNMPPQHALYQGAEAIQNRLRLARPAPAHRSPVGSRSSPPTSAKDGGWSEKSPALRRALPTDHDSALSGGKRGHPELFEPGGFSGGSFRFRSQAWTGKPAAGVYAPFDSAARAVPRLPARAAPLSGARADPRPHDRSCGAGLADHSLGTSVRGRAAALRGALSAHTHRYPRISIRWRRLLAKRACGRGRWKRLRGK